MNAVPRVSDTLKEVSERAFSADGIANQQSQKIYRFIAAEAHSHEADPARAKASRRPLDAKWRAMMTTSANHAGDSRAIERRGVNLNTRVRYHSQRDL
jgi:hypothetical protein